MEKFRPIESFDQEIQRKLDEAKSKALTWGEVQMYTDQMRELESQIVDIPNPELVKKFNALADKLNEAHIHVNTISEFKLLLDKIALNNEHAKALLNHENAHANVAQSVGVDHDGYIILVRKEDDGTFYYSPMATWKFPAEWWDKKENIEKTIQIFSAPQEYGDRMSVDDKDNVKELQDKLREFNS